MTTGATGQLGLALPVQGELSGTWGDTVNNGITQYTNLAIAATLTLTNDGAVTLANTTGDASATNITSSLTGAGTVTAQHAIVRVTGTLTTTKVITAPSYSKTYVVVNAATGGTVTFKASGQTGVSIAVGESAYVYYNGTDYVKVVGTATAGAAGGSNTQVQYNSSGSLAGSANMTFDGTKLTVANILDSGLTASKPVFTDASKNLVSTGTLGVDQGGTGQTTANAAFNALVPSQTTNAGKFLTTDGTNTSWATAASGTVTAVSVATANGFAGTSSGGATPSLTLTTSITGLLKGNGTAMSAATAGTDYVAPGGALGTPSSGTVTNLTGTATININGTVGATTPNTGAFTTLSFNSGYGSVATAYGCRAWVNFNGTGTVAIRASGNVSSITDNGTGLYTINFTTAMSDANYSINATGFWGGGQDYYSSGWVMSEQGSSSSSSYRTTSSVQISGQDSSWGPADSAFISVAVFR